MVDLFNIKLKVLKSIIDKKLKHGGLLFIDQCDFNFLETSVANEYIIYPNIQNFIRRVRPIYAYDGKKVSDKSRLFRVFLKKI